MATVRRLDRADVPAIIHVFADAFRDYPVMRHVLGDAPGYGRRLHRLVRLFVMARALRAEPMFGIHGPNGVLAGAMTVSFPGVGETPAEFPDLRREVFEDLGADAQERYESYGAATAGFHFDDPHAHVNMIGVRPVMAGSGFARLMLECVHRVAEERPGTKGISLTTEDPRNVAFYEHMGYELVGRARVTDGLETWGFFRRSRGR
jgi:GNAT superfamily N-acetyltransferase